MLETDFDGLQRKHGNGRSVSMVRELQLLTVGFVFAFLGAIVMGVF